MTGFMLALVIVAALALIEIVIGLARRSKSMIFIGLVLLLVCALAFWVTYAYEGTLGPIRSKYTI